MNVSSNHTSTRFCVLVVWNYRPSQIVERCTIFPALPEHEADDGIGYASSSGDGMDFRIFDSLEEAIVQSHFDPFAINFKNLSKADSALKDEILSRCSWTPKGGLTISMKFKIITLCGSTKFKDEFIAKNKELTLAGNIVISVGLFGHSGDSFTDEQKIMLDEMHKRKIDLADAIYVINKGGYIGKSTQSEIEYAKQHGKEIIFMETPT